MACFCSGPPTVAKFICRKDPHIGIAEYIERSLGNDIRTKPTVPAVSYSQGLQAKIPPSPPISPYLRYILFLWTITCGVFHHLVFISSSFLCKQVSSSLCSLFESVYLRPLFHRLPFFHNQFSFSSTLATFSKVCLYRFPFSV